MKVREFLAAIERGELPPSYSKDLRKLFTRRVSIEDWGEKDPKYNDFPFISLIFGRKGTGGDTTYGLVSDYQNGKAIAPERLKTAIAKLRGMKGRGAALAYYAKQWALSENESEQMAANLASNLLGYVMATTKEKKPSFEFTFRPPKDREPDLVVTDYLKENAVPMGVGAAIALAIRAFLK